MVVLAPSRSKPTNTVRGSRLRRRRTIARADPDAASLRLNPATGKAISLSPSGGRAVRRQRGTGDLATLSRYVARRRREAWPLRDHRQARRRRHGRSVAGARYAVSIAGRDQGFGREVQCAFRARGASSSGAQSPEHLQSTMSGPITSCSSTSMAHRSPRPRACASCSISPCRSPTAWQPRRGRSRAARTQTQQRLCHARRPRQDPGFRPREERRGPARRHARANNHGSGLVAGTAA